MNTDRGAAEADPPNGWQTGAKREGSSALPSLFNSVFKYFSCYQLGSTSFFVSSNFVEIYVITIPINTASKHIIVPHNLSAVNSIYNGMDNKDPRLTVQ